MEAKTNLMHIFLSIYLTSIFVPVILRYITCKSQSSKHCSSYTFKYPMFLVLLFLIGILVIVALCVGAFAVCVGAVCIIGVLIASNKAYK